MPTGRLQLHRRWPQPRQPVSQAGFSLIELLVVILIVGILATVMIPRFLGQRDSSNDASAQSNLRNAATQLQSWYLQNGESYPASTDSSGLNDLADFVCSSEPSLSVAGRCGALAGTTGGPPTAPASCSGSMCTPGSSADPNRVFLTTGPTAGKSNYATVCSVSKGAKTFCTRLSGTSAAVVSASTYGMDVNASGTPAASLTSNLVLNPTLASGLTNWTGAYHTGDPYSTFTWSSSGPFSGSGSAVKTAGSGASPAPDSYLFIGFYTSPTPDTMNGRTVTASVWVRFSTTVNGSITLREPRSLVTIYEVGYWAGSSAHTFTGGKWYRITFQPYTIDASKFGVGAPWNLVIQRSSGTFAVGDTVSWSLPTMVEGSTAQYAVP